MDPLKKKELGVGDSHSTQSLLLTPAQGSLLVAVRWDHDVGEGTEIRCKARTRSIARKTIFLASMIRKKNFKPKRGPGGPERWYKQ